MPLQRGEVQGYNFNRMAVEFTMVNQCKVVPCSISTAAMDDLEGRRDVKSDKRIDQFMRTASALTVMTFKMPAEGFCETILLSLMQLEFTVDRIELRWLDQLAMRHAHGMHGTIQLLLPER